MPSLISIIVPVFNAESTLAKCLDSIVSQRDVDLEVILVDDGSSDGSAAICENYRQRHDGIKVIRTSNQGASGARNAGMRHASGDYVAFVDADDWVGDGYWIRLLDAAMAGDADVVCGRVALYQGGHVAREEDCRRFLVEPAHSRRVDRLDLIRLEFYPAPWGKLYRTAVLKNNHIEFLQRDGYGGFAEDILFSFNVLIAAKNVVYANVTYFYNRDNAGSICSDPSRQSSNNVDRAIIIEEMLRLSDEKRLDPEEMEPVLFAVSNHLHWGGRESVEELFRRMPNNVWRRQVTDYVQACGEAVLGRRRKPLLVRLKGFYMEHPAAYRWLRTLFFGVRSGSA